MRRFTTERDDMSQLLASEKRKRGLAPLFYEGTDTGEPVHIPGNRGLQDFRRRRVSRLLRAPCSRTRQSFFLFPAGLIAVVVRRQQDAAALVSVSVLGSPLQSRVLWRTGHEAFSVTLDLCTL